VAFFTGAFFTAVFFAGAFPVAFFTGAFLADAFVAGAAFFAGAFAVAFFTGAFLAGAFFAADLFATAFVDDDLAAAPLRAPPDAVDRRDTAFRAAEAALPASDLVVLRAMTSLPEPGRENGSDGTGAAGAVRPRRV
jgi:hypothetical protein